jgi:hypothetical protein
MPAGPIELHRQRNRLNRKAATSFTKGFEMNKIATLHRQRALLAVLCLMLSAGFLFGQWRVTRSNPAARLTAAPVPMRTTAPNPAPAAPAQSGGSYNITQSVIPGGGGTSANGNTRLTLPTRTVCAGIPANAAAVTGNNTVVLLGGRTN